MGQKNANLPKSAAPGLKLHFVFNNGYEMMHKLEVA